MSLVKEKSLETTERRRVRRSGIVAPPGLEAFRRGGLPAIQMPPLRGSSDVKRHRSAPEELSHKFVEHDRILQAKKEGEPSRRSHPTESQSATH